MALALHQIFASASQDMEARYAISCVQLENGANLVKRIACARMKPSVTHSMANVCAPEDGLVFIVIKHALLTDMDRIAGKSVAADTVEAAITSLANAIVPLATQDLFATIYVLLENTVTNANQSASVRTVVPAVLLPVNASVTLDGLVQSVRIVVQMVSGV